MSEALKDPDFSVYISLGHSLGRLPDGLKATLKEAAHVTIGFHRIPDRDCVPECDFAGTSVTVRLAGSKEMRSLNRKFRGIDRVTNVLAFPAPSMPGTGGDEPSDLGDVVLAVPVALSEARERSISPIEHMAHLTIHGILHLIGYDHNTETVAQEMEAREREIMATLGYSDPYTDRPGL